MEQPTVTIQHGKLRGKTGVDYDGRKYYSFQGVPYAEPPLGNLRFKPPQPVQPWDGTRDATQESKACPQVVMWPQLKRATSEDCLYLNVYTPQLPSGENVSLKPVMVWVHGGAFTMGSGDTSLYGPEFLLINDVVVVSFNYRLGLLGFLRADDPSQGIPGNAGLRDVVMVLEWVKNNIGSFSGDPNNVTVFGESAGSAAVHYLLLSPLAKGLFHKAILQSGTVFNPWARGFQSTKKPAQILKLPVANQRDVVDKLVDLRVEDLLEVQNRLKDPVTVFKRPLGPAVEGANFPPFLIEDPIQTHKAGNYNKVPVMIGYCKREGNLSECFARWIGRKPVHENFEALVPYDLDLPKDSAATKRVARKIKEFYYSDGNTDNPKSFSTLEADLNINIGVTKTVRLLSENSGQPVYYFRFSLEAIKSPLHKIAAVNLPGTCHGDDLLYLFKLRQPVDVEPGSAADVAIRQVTKMWTNFAKYGDPNIKGEVGLPDTDWKPVTKDALNFLDIGERLVAGVNPEAERTAFWDDIYRTNGRPHSTG